MTNLTIEMPDDLAHILESMAAAQHKSIQQLAIERLSSLAEATEYRVGSAAALLRAIQEPPHLSPSDVDELDAAMAAGRMPIRTHDLFSD